MIFEFEKDFGGRLSCIPMAVRHKLDLTGVKLSMKEWLAMSEEERRDLVNLPYVSGNALDFFRERLLLLVKERAGAEPETMAPDSNPPWQDLSRVPEDLAQKSKEENVPISSEQWAGLSELQRFALVKLSRRHHQNKNFVPAAREFGLCP